MDHRNGGASAKAVGAAECRVPSAECRALSVLACLVLIASPLAGQPVGRVAIGASLVEFDGFLSSGAVVFAPSLQFDTPRLSLLGHGGWTRFESGSGVLQADLTAGWLVGSARWWRLELSGSAGASRYAAEPGSGHLLAGARIHAFRSQAGGWIGVATGQSFGGTALGIPVEFAAAGWHVRQRWTLLGTATATRFSGDRYLDVAGTARWAGPGVELEARLGARPIAQSAAAGAVVGTGGYGQVSAVVPVTQGLAVSIGVGNQLSDPVRRVLGARYLNAGIRIRAFGPGDKHASFEKSRAIMRRLVSLDGGAATLEVRASAGLHTVRVRAAGVASVDLMGDFTDWAIVSLTEVTPGVFEVRLPLSPGLYRLNVRLGGGSWIVPGGTRVERTEFGSVGVVVVPDLTN